MTTSFHRRHKVLVAQSSGTELELGRFRINAGGELANARITLFKVGPSAGIEELRLKLYSGADYNDPLCASDWRALDDLEGLSTLNNFVGRVRFDFDREVVADGTDLYVALETQFYTRVGNTFYLGVSCDYPAAVGVHTPAAGSESRNYAAVEFFFLRGYRG